MRQRRLTVILSVALAITGIWGVYNYILNRQHTIQMDNMYQRSFFDMVGHVNNIETSLSKLMVSGDQSQHLILVSDIWRHADSAQVSLASLPISHISLAKTAKLLNQMSDYSNYLARSVGQGKTLSLEEANNLKELHKNYVKLGEELRALQDSINNGKVSWRDIGRQGRRLGRQTEDIITNQLVKIEKSDIKYPSLIYDGPFSESLKEFENIELDGDEVDQGEAINIVKEFIGEDKVSRVHEWSENNGDIKCWGVYAEMKDGRGPFYFTVSKKGGKVVNMLGDTGEHKIRISPSEAKKLATNFLGDKGYKDMTPTYEKIHHGICTINFAYKQDDIIVYPDLIKVKISLDNGQMVGFECKNYLISHRAREIEEPTLSLDEARALLSSDFEVESERLAIIPTPSRKERLCYEFNGKFGEDKFIIYIDANTGQEADILKIIDSHTGTLVI